MSNPYSELGRDSLKNSAGGVYAELVFSDRLRQYLIEGKTRAKTIQLAIRDLLLV